jgi:hypothetical protein
MVSASYHDDHSGIAAPGIQADNDTQDTPRLAGMLTAHGSRDSHAVVLKDGRQNGSPRAGTAYGTVTWADIRALVDAPAGVLKEDAQWFVPSSYVGSDGRTHAVQRDRGTFHGLAIDIDKGNPSIDMVVQAVAAVTGGARAEV